MHNRRAVLLLLVGLLSLIVLVASCTGIGLAVRAGQAPALDWRIPIGSYRVVLIHNGPTITCARGLRDICRGHLVRYEFYVHYMAPDADHTLIWIPTAGP